jgi:hypothetical protein
MNSRHTEPPANFTSIDDIINFYTRNLQHSDSKKKELDRKNKPEHSHRK